MVSLPKMVKIGGHYCDVVFPYVFKERGDVSGQATYGSPREIRISLNSSVGHRLDDGSIIVVFIHELIHQILDVFNGGKQIDDGVISSLSEGIYAILVDNGWIDCLINNNNNYDSHEPD